MKALFHLGHGNEQCIHYFLFAVSAFISDYDSDQVLSQAKDPVFIVKEWVGAFPFPCS